MKKFYIYQLGKNKEEQWDFIVKSAFQIADSMNFTPIWPNWYLQDELNPFRKNITKLSEIKRIHEINKFVNLNLTGELKSFVANMKFDFWKNYYLEDPSFIKGKTEFIATRSRKDQVIMLLSENERKHLINKGFDIWFDISGEAL